MSGAFRQRMHAENVSRLLVRFIGFCVEQRFLVRREQERFLRNIFG